MASVGFIITESTTVLTGRAITRYGSSSPPPVVPATKHEGQRQSVIPLKTLPDARRGFWNHFQGILTVFVLEPLDHDQGDVVKLQTRI